MHERFGGRALPDGRPHPRCAGQLKHPLRSPSASACEPYREVIESGLRKGRTAMSLYQELVDTHGFPHRYACVSRYARKLRTESGDVSDAHPVIVTEPGVEAQVDYGTGPLVRHPETGKYRRTRLFVLTLGHSRKAVRLLLFKSSTEAWCTLHEKAFRRLGGAPKIVVLDNLREGVLKPDIYDPELNPLYKDMLRHYGVTAMPCRVRHPNRKGKVEAAVKHTQNALKGLRFESIEDAQAYLDRWDARWADTRIHGTTKRQVKKMFEEERPALSKLPESPFRYYAYGVRKVHLDGCVEVKAAFYSAPPAYVGRTVEVHFDACTVRILDRKTKTLLRRHVRQRPGRYRIEREDRPKRTPPETHQLLARASHAGQHTGALAKHIHASCGQTGVRRILGLLSLCKKYGAAPTDDACAAAFELGAPTYRFVRRYLERKPPISKTLAQIDPLIRTLCEYQGIIDQRTQGENQ